MNTQHLKYAIEVGKTGSITQAAENLYIGQPSLSKALKELEESLGIVIFKRTSKGAVPTAQGERFLMYARDVLRQVEKMESLRRADQLTAQIFRAAMPRVDYIRRASRTVIDRADAGRDMNICLHRCGAIQGMRLVTEGECDLAVIRYPIRYERYFLDYMNEKRLRCDPIGEGRQTLVLNAAHSMAEAEAVREEAMAAFPMVTYSDESVPYLSEEDETEGRRLIKVSDTAALCDALRMIPGSYAWCDALSDEDAERLGLKRIAGVGPRIRDALVYMEGYELGALDRVFIDAVYAERNRMLYEKN